MRDFNVAGRDVNVSNQNSSSEKSWLKIVLAIITFIGVVITALLSSQWSPQIWDKINLLF